MKYFLRRLPILKQIFRKFDTIGEAFSDQREAIISLQRIAEETNSTLRAYEAELKNQKKQFTLRINAMKRNLNIPIKVVILLEEPSVVKNMLTLLEQLEKDERFELVLINLWHKSLGDNKFRRPNVESVIDVSKYNVIESYDAETEQWFPLESLFPDYVFFSRPYDHYRHENYQIKAISKYSKTCHIPYGIQVIGGEVERLILTPECSDLYYYFVDNSMRVEYVKEHMARTQLSEEGKIMYLGYPGLDMLREHNEIKEKNTDDFTLLWLPRWRTSENNCHFFEYKDALIDFANSSKSRVLFRPHSLCFENFINTGEMTLESLAELRRKYSYPHIIDESSNYIEAFAMSSVLVADETSLIAEYFLTGKPIIFCKKEPHYSSIMLKLIEGCYVVESEQELIYTLKQLKNGRDVLEERRNHLLQEVLMDYGASAASNIIEELWKDFNAIN